MRITRIFTDQPLHHHGEVTLGKDAGRHLVTVLRQKPGDAVCLFNGQGGEFYGEIIAADARQVVVGIGAFDADNRQSPLKTLLGIGISRGERFEWVLQKATELGVTEIFPLYTERTEVKLKGDREDKKHSRWQQVIISACEQSGRNLLPVLHPPQPLTGYLNIDADIRLLLHHRSNQTLQTLANLQPASAALLIGSEGGLSESEIHQAGEKGFQSLTLGSRILRTETAPLAVLSVLQGLWGDF